jgi:Fe-S oxidoreductase
MVLEAHRETMQGCVRCSYCKFITLGHIKSWRFSNGCPSIAFNGFQTYSAGGRLAAALSLLEGRSDYTDKLKEIVYQCHMCGMCDVACKACRYDMEVMDALREVRFQMVADGQTLPEHAALIENLRNEGHMAIGPSTDSSLESARFVESGVKDLSRDRGPVVFHFGCQARRDEQSAKVAGATIKVLMSAGIDVGIMGASERCCGGTAYDLGYKEEFEACAEANMRAWAEAGVKTVVTSCAHCYHSFKRLYAARGGEEFQVLHGVELIGQLVKEGKLKLRKSVPLTVTYHDPCHLGRLGENYVPWQGTKTKVFGTITKHVPPKPRYNGAWGVYEAPRDLLRAIPGARLIEMERIRENAWCCGGGSGVGEAYPAFSAWTATERIEEAEATGADILTSACLRCEAGLTAASMERGQRIEVVDIVELVDQAL